MASLHNSAQPRTAPIQLRKTTNWIVLLLWSMYDERNLFKYSMAQKKT